MRLDTLKILITGLLGGVLGAFLVLYIVFTYFGDNLEAYLSSQFRIRDDGSIENQKLIPTPLPLLAPDFWEHISSEASFSSVAIQVFKDNRIIKSGSGIILSSDGLVVIPADLTSLGSTYQVLYEDKIVKGAIVSFDVKRNLAIIKITNLELNLNVSDLNTGLIYQNGQDVLITGKLYDISKPAAIAQRGIISYVSGGRIILDTL